MTDRVANPWGERTPFGAKLCEILAKERVP